MSDLELVGLTDGFEAHYRHASSEWAKAYRSALVVLDTNALLDLYRLSPAGRRDLMSLLRAVRARIFIPHQVAVEFHRRRANAVEGRIDELQKKAASLREAKSKAVREVRDTARRMRGADGRDASVQVLEALDNAFAKAADFMSEAAEDYDLDPDVVAVERDAVLVELEEPTQGRVAPPPSDEVLAVDMKGAERRAPEQDCPGL